MRCHQLSNNSIPMINIKKRDCLNIFHHIFFLFLHTQDSIEKQQNISEGMKKRHDKVIKRVINLKWVEFATRNSEWKKQNKKRRNFSLSMITKRRTEKKAI